MKKSAQLTIHISVPRQVLTLKRGRFTLRQFPVSTSKFGLGWEEGSMKTPLGRFCISEKFGDGLPLETAFKSRVPIPATAKMLRADDLIMSRILWLNGLESKNANSRARYIYIHGTNHEELLGTPASHGCVRMRKADVAELYDLVPLGARVTIASSTAREKTRKAFAQRK